MTARALQLDLVYRSTVRTTYGLSRGLVVRVFEASRSHLRLPAGSVVELSVSVIGPARMRTLNRRWRKKDSPTDVLAFPLSGPIIKGYTTVSLGDLFICPAMVRAKADLWGNSVHVQMRWTLVHGLLHLAGHDHEHSSAAARRMADIEQKILQELGT